jgi:dTDP-4-dehydrorhamnose 3,5-epimerase
MEVLPTRLPGVVLLKPEIHGDDRGFFLEMYRRDTYTRVGIGVEFVQDNHSRSQRGVVRGLHFQTGLGQAKLVHVARGHVFDVVVDLRPGSSTFGQHETFDLDDREHLQLYIPGGFAHGFCVVSDTADVVYKVGSYYESDRERGLAWNDPSLAIEWPIPDPVLSERDRNNPRLRDIEIELGR